MNKLTPMQNIVIEEVGIFIENAVEAMGSNLLSAVLFGSAAEGNLRSTSDINLLLILKNFEQDEVDKIRDSLVVAHASVRLEVMFLLDAEKELAMNAFAVKFFDILTRRKILYGVDPFSDSSISLDAMRRRTRQILLNLLLRMRERYALVSKREEQLASIIADVIGPLRACAKSILKLEDRGMATPKDALNIVISEMDEVNGEPLSTQIDMLRRQGSITPGSEKALLFLLMHISQQMYQRTMGNGRRVQENGCV